MNAANCSGSKFRAELKFWMIHCFVSVAPLIAFTFVLGSSRGFIPGTLGKLSATALFAIACALIGIRFGGYAKSRAIFPRALRVILQLRALQVGLFFAIYLVGMLVKPVAGLAIFLIVPDFICGLRAERIYDRLSENVTVKGSVILEACHPFLSSLVSTGLFAVVWSVVFCVLTLPTMIVLSFRNPTKRQGRAGGFR